MTLNKRTVSIVGAVLVSTGLITGAFALSGPLPFVSVIKKADAQSTEELLKAFAGKDTDKDGLPDWEEALFGTDPKNPQSVQAGTLDSEAVAMGLVQPKFVTEESVASRESIADDIPGDAPASDSVTEQFSRIFFKNYMATIGSESPTEVQVLQFATDAVNELTESRQYTQQYTLGQVKVAGSGAEAIRAYMIDAENAFLKHPTKAGSPELEYVTAAVTTDDTSSLAKADEIADLYMAQADELMKLSVPSELRLPHLALANSLYHLGEVTHDMAVIDEDPLRGMLGIIDYKQVAYDTMNALGSYAKILNATGVTFQKGETGYDLENRANIISDVLQRAESQQQ